MGKFKNIGEEVFLTRAEPRCTVEIHGVEQSVIYTGPHNIFTKNTNYNSKKESKGGFLNNISEVVVKLSSELTKTYLHYKSGSQWYRLVLGDLHGANDAACILLAPYYNSMTSSFQGDFRLTKVGRGFLIVPSEYINTVYTTKSPTISVKKMELGVCYSNSNNSYMKIYEGKESSIIITDLTYYSNDTIVFQYRAFNKAHNTNIFEGNSDFLQHVKRNWYRGYNIEIVPNKKRVTYNKISSYVVNESVLDVGKQFATEAEI